MHPVIINRMYIVIVSRSIVYNSKSVYSNKVINVRAAAHKPQY
jgi:hypothetical protein